MKRILVVGTHTGVGKTTFCETLVKLLRLRGSEAVGFKPSGEFWLFDHTDAVFRCLEEGRLFGHDADALAAASGADVAPELVAPCYRLMGPNYRLKDLVHEGTELYAARMTDWSSGEAAHRYAVVPRLFEAAGMGRLLAKLRDSGHEVREVSSFADLVSIAPLARAAVQSALAALEARFDTVVMESFGFSGLPYIDLGRVDVVIALGTGVAARYEASGYLRAALAAQARLLEQARAAGANATERHPLYRVFGLAGTRAIVGGLRPQSLVRVRAVRREGQIEEWQRIAEQLVPLAA